jgi:hypothetical protein
MPHKILFSFEVPIANLQDFQDLQDFNFTLSMLYKHEKYEQHVRRERRLGLRTIWLDNSYNEQMVATNWEELLRLFQWIGAHRLISPDAPAWTAQQIMSSYLHLNATLPSESIICVASSPQMFYKLRNDGVSNFAVSYWVRPHLSREDLFAMRGCHFLGLLSVKELVLHRPYSCDTSMPIKLALIGQSLRQWNEEGCKHINTKDLGVEGQDFFLTEMSTKQIDLARQNIIDLKEAVR